MRNGFGTYSIPTEDGGYTKQYSGGWKDNHKHVGDVIVHTRVCFYGRALLLPLANLQSYFPVLFMGVPNYPCVGVIPLAQNWGPQPHCPC